MTTTNTRKTLLLKLLNDALTSGLISLRELDSALSRHRVPTELRERCSALATEYGIDAEGFRFRVRLTGDGLSLNVTNSKSVAVTERVLFTGMSDVEAAAESAVMMLLDAPAATETKREPSPRVPNRYAPGSRSVSWEIRQIVQSYGKPKCPEGAEIRCTKGKDGGITIVLMRDNRVMCRGIGQRFKEARQAHAAVDRLLKAYAENHAQKTRE